jgi:hypothetical protein
MGWIRQEVCTEFWAVRNAHLKDQEMRWEDGTFFVSVFFFCSYFNDLSVFLCPCRPTEGQCVSAVAHFVEVS